MTEQKPDNIYATPLDRVSEFAFDEAVARVFPDMIQRSVPGYTTIIPMISVITEQYAQNGSTCYDLGCSLGASTLAMRQGLRKHDCSIIGVDNSKSMLDRCRHYIELDNEETPVQLKHSDIMDIAFSDCSVVTLNFTLQFLKPEDRTSLLERIYNAMRPGGALILSEKIQFANGVEQEHLQELHWSFKRANGYSELEISQKRSALENVLIPDTFAQHKERLNSAGFSNIFKWYQCFNFMSLIAVK